MAVAAISTASAARSTLRVGLAEAREDPMRVGDVVVISTQVVVLVSAEPPVGDHILRRSAASASAEAEDAERNTEVCEGVRVPHELTLALLVRRERAVLAVVVEVVDVVAQLLPVRDRRPLRVDDLVVVASAVGDDVVVLVK